MKLIHEKNKRARKFFNLLSRDIEVEKKQKQYDALVAAYEKKHGITLQEAWIKHGWGE